MKSEWSELRGNRKFKIAFDARAAQAKGVGVATCANTIIKELAKVEDQFDFVFIIDSKLDVSHMVFPANSEIISTRVGRGSLLLRDFWMQCVLPRKLRSVGVHLFHQFDYFLPIWPVDFIVVGSFLDAIAFTSLDDRNVLSRMRVKYFLRKGGNNADAIITISDYSKRELLKYLDVEPEKITRVWCVVPDTYYISANHDEISSCVLKLGFSDKFILYYGGYSKRKNVGLLLDAYRIVLQQKDLSLLLVGILNEETRNMVRSLDLVDKVKVFGYASEEELKVLLGRCEVFVFPSCMEGFGLPVAEAMACGAPVICSKNGSLPEIGGDAVYYFEGTEPANLASAIFDVLDNSALRERLRDRGPIRALMFRGEQTVKTLLKVYMDLLESRYSRS
ncbi:glycosyltransferase family 4 protein [Acidobacteria bacterium AH-259-D05]|nr:glycosyltransferase family 4 protein [Acidobacteria bacterium AH-259-D05]